MSTLTLNEMQQLIKKHGGDECVRKFLAEETVVAPVHGTVYVDRTICPTYPQWVDKVLYPELESTGPAEFDAGKLELWLHNGQKTGCVTGKTIHQYLQDHDTCLKTLSACAIWKKFRRKVSLSLENTSKANMYLAGKPSFATAVTTSASRTCEFDGQVLPHLVLAPLRLERSLPRVVARKCLVFEPLALFDSLTFVLWQNLKIRMIFGKYLNSARFVVRNFLLSDIIQNESR